MALFDAYVMVDWSGASKPASQEDSIWIASSERRSQTIENTVLINAATRCDAFDFLCDILRRHVNANRRVLACFDFAYGYPTGFAAALGHDAEVRCAEWKFIWNRLATEVVDAQDNTNNRFEVAGRLNDTVCGAPRPFWGCSVDMQTNRLRSRKLDELHGGFPINMPTGPLREHRICETQILGTKSAWQLTGAGAVGSQSLLGMPYLNRLRFHDDFVEISHVWPFETGFSDRSVPSRGPFILHAEIWPGTLPANRLKHPVLINDASQLSLLGMHIASLDMGNGLPPLFRGPLASNTEFDDESLNAVQNAEGWILGVH